MNQNHDSLTLPPPAPSVDSIDPMTKCEGPRPADGSGGVAAVAGWLRDSFDSLFSLDLRSLGLFRIAIGAILVIDAVRRWFLVEAFYSDAGVYPRSLNLELLPRNHWSLHLATGTVWGEGILFAIGFLSGAAFLLGFRTRLANALSFLLLLSLHNRNSFIINGGDALMRQLLFWGLFLPLGARFSVDRALLEKGAPGSLCRRQAVSSIGSAALILQLCFVYIYSACVKTSPMWRTDGTAVHYALHLASFATAFGGGLLRYPTLLKWLTKLTILLEYFGPLLLFVPVGRVPCRIIAVVLFSLFHLGIGLAFNIKTFAAVGITAWLALLPGAVWDYAAVRAGFALRGLERLRAKLATLPMVVNGRARLRGERLHLRLGLLGSLVAAALFLAALSELIRGLELPALKQYAPAWLDGVCAALRIDERWTMFAPDIPQSSGWCVADATLRSGREVDLRRGGGPVSWERPATISETYETVEWANYFVYLQGDRYARFRPYYAAFLCRKWNEAHEKASQVKVLNLYFMRENTPPPGGTVEHPLEKILLLTYQPASI